MYFKAGKRFFDLVVSIVLLVMLIPVFFIISLVSLMVHGPGSIFFLQERIGYKGRPFLIVKFKTMTDERDEFGDLLPDEKRTTAWGMFMRKCSIDELLQLINVLKGDMSIIGPRPLVESQVRNLTTEERSRFMVRPGITGLAQVCGRNELSFYHRFRYDVWYVNHLSPELDLRIIWMTIKVVTSGDGVEYNPQIQNGIIAKK